MSFYVTSESELENGKPFGNHRRAIIYNTLPDYEKIVSAETSGDYITRLPNTQEERGKLLVIGKLYLYYSIQVTKYSSLGPRQIAR